MTRAEAETVLIEAGKSDDEGFPLLEASIACALHEDPNRDATQALALAAEGARRLSRRLADSPADQAIADAMAGDLRLTGDRESYDSPQNADIVSVSERRRGLPVALGIFYIDAARRCGLQLHGVDFPGHFLLRLDSEPGPLAIDPFNDGDAVREAELTRRALRAGVTPASAGDVVTLLTPVSDRAVLVRLQNNIFARALSAGDLARAERAALRRAIVDPADPRLWLGVAAVRERQGALAGALDALGRVQALDERAELEVRAIRERVRLRLN